MLFRNKSDDDRDLVQGGVKIVTIARGETHVVTADEAPGIVLQCGPDGAWEPADDEAVAAVAEATKPPEDEPLARPALSASKAEWVAFAESLGDADAASKTKPQLIDEHNQEV